jgi:hypothetical protein
VSETLPTAMGEFLVAGRQRRVWEAEPMNALAKRQGGFTRR